MTNDIYKSDSTRPTTEEELTVCSETYTTYCDKAVGDSWSDVDNNEIGAEYTFRKGQTVYYKSSIGVAEEAVIVEVHHDDVLVPYYTIRLLVRNREKQTHGARISALSDLYKSQTSTPYATTPRPLQSILRPSSYGKKAKAVPVTLTQCESVDKNVVPPSCTNFLESIEKKLSQLKAREKRDIQVVTPEPQNAYHERIHRQDVTPRQLLYTGARKRKRSDCGDIGVTRERKRRKISFTGDEETTILTDESALPFYFIPQASKTSKSSTCNSHRVYPKLDKQIPLDWPINGGGYNPISFQDNRQPQENVSSSLEYQMILFDEILSKLEKDATEESGRRSTRPAISIHAILSPIATFLSSFSRKYLSHSWEYIQSKLSFGNELVEQKGMASDSTDSAVSDQDCSKVRASDVTQQPRSTPVLQANSTRRGKVDKPHSQQCKAAPTVITKSLLPRPPDRWQNAFAVKTGHWKCKSCFYQNPSDAMTCDVCTELRDDRRVSSYTPSNENQCNATQSSDAQTSDLQSYSSQSRESETDDSFSETDDSYTGSDSQITSSDDTCNDAERPTGNCSSEDVQTDFSSTQPTEGFPNVSKVTKIEQPNVSQSNTANAEGGGRRLSSLASAAERIKADRARAALHAQQHHEEDSDANRNKRLRRERNAEAQLEVIDLDLDSIAETPEEIDVESVVDSMSVTSNMSIVRSEMMMELDDTEAIKPGAYKMK